MTERYWKVDQTYVSAHMPTIDISEDSIITAATLDIIISSSTAEAEMELTDAIGLDNLNRIYAGGPRTNAYKNVQFLIFTVLAPRLVQAARTYGMDVEALRNEADRLIARIRANPQSLGYLENEDGDVTFEEYAETTVTSTSAPRTAESKWANLKYF